MDEFATDDKVTFIIKFNKKANTMKAAEEGRAKAANQNVSGLKMEHMQRSAVVSALKSTSLESQQNVKDYLEKERDNGNAEGIHSYFIVNGMAVTATKEVAEKVATFKEVEKILPNEKRQLFTSGTTEKDNPKAHLADNVEWNVDRINAPEVWDMGIDGTGTVVATIDSGVQWDHPALKEKYRGYDPATGEVDHNFNWYDATEGESEPYDNMGHGTHVTGTMVGGEQDGFNQVGVAPGANWIAVKAFTEDGGRDTDLLDAAEWIIAPTDAEGNERIDLAPDVVNNSWGGGAGLDEWYRDVVIAWRHANIFPEFSAGNTGLFNPGGPGSIANPANYPESFATGATDVEDNLAEFSLRGPSPYEEIKPDISAPGVNIRSSVPGNGYAVKNGTSMSGPAVSAVAAMLRQVDSTLSVDDMEEILMDTAVPMTNEEYQESPNNGFGHGLVNAFEAVSFIAEGVGAIEGDVTTQGEDMKDPTFDHTAPLEVYDGMDTTLRIDVQDNVSVLSVELKYQINGGGWQTIDAALTSGDHMDGEYKVVIPGEELEQGSLTYQWIINDYGDNEVNSEEHEAEIKSGITVGYFEDFEEQPAGWTSFGVGDDWEWGVPTSGPDSAASGEHVYATNLDGSYTKGADATLVMPAIDLPDEDAYLNFDLWYDLEEVHDVGYVYVSTDQEEWNMEKIVFYDSDGWEPIEIDLSEYSGQRVYIGYNIFSNTPNDVEKPGLYLDNVGLSTTSQNSSASMLDDKIKQKLQKDNVDLEKIKKKTPEKDVEKEIENPAALPLNAEVSVLNTSRSTGTNPTDGSYSLTSLAAGEYTVQADAYGYHTEQQTVNVVGNETTQQNFVLEEVPKGTISGTITDESTGDTVEGATLLLVEDANVTPVESDGNGQYDLTAYEGTYTLKVVANGYHYEETEITIDEEQMEVNIELTPYHSYKTEEIGYDDGSGEIARTFYGAGNRAAVKVSLPENEDSALITDGVFQFHNDHLPRPGGTEFAVEVWDATGDDGMPGEKLAGPIEAEAIRDINELTVVDLSDENIIVNGDFYMVYVQTNVDNYSPGLASDVDGPYAGRSYEHVSGFWDQSNEIEGNYMIRARVAYEVDAPVINSIEDGYITKEKAITIEGTGSPGTKVKLLNGGEDVGMVNVGEEGSFNISTELTEGENELSAVSMVDGEETKESNPVTVYLDTQAPELTVESPQDGDKTNRETVTVEGTVADEHLEFVKVNDRQAEVKDGEYSKRIILDEGENTIEVAAQDQVGHTETKEVTIQAKYTEPAIQNLKPTEDKELQAGESVKIEFDSEAGLNASFVIHMPLTNTSAQITNVTELPMMEITEGHYVGYWTAPNNVKAEGAVIEVKASDSFGNETYEQAGGKLTINMNGENNSIGKE